jgi:hypothetical protein
MTGADQLGPWPTPDPDQAPGGALDDNTLVPEPEVWPDEAAGAWPRRRRSALPPIPTDQTPWAPDRPAAGDGGPSTEAWSMDDDPDDGGQQTQAWPSTGGRDEPEPAPGWDALPQPEPWLPAPPPLTPPSRRGSWPPALGPGGPLPGEDVQATQAWRPGPGPGLDPAPAAPPPRLGPGRRPDRPTPPHAWADPGAQGPTDRGRPAPAPARRRGPPAEPGAATQAWAPGPGGAHAAPGGGPPRPGHGQASEQAPGQGPGWRPDERGHPPEPGPPGQGGQPPGGWQGVDHRARPQGGSNAYGGHQGGAPEWAPPWAGRASATRGMGPGEQVVAPGRARRRQTASGRGAREKKVWPRRAAILAAIVILMVVSWFWIFPWLETVLPSEY